MDTSGFACSAYAPRAPRLGSLPQWCTSSTAAPVIWVRRCTLAIIPAMAELLFSSAIPAIEADSVSITMNLAPCFSAVSANSLTSFSLAMLQGLKT